MTCSTMVRSVLRASNACTAQRVRKGHDAEPRSVYNLPPIPVEYRTQICTLLNAIPVPEGEQRHHITYNR